MSHVETGYMVTRSSLNLKRIIKFGEPNKQNSSLSCGQESSNLWKPKKAHCYVSDKDSRGIFRQVLIFDSVIVIVRPYLVTSNVTLSHPLTCVDAVSSQARFYTCSVIGWIFFVILRRCCLLYHFIFEMQDTVV